MMTMGQLITPDYVSELDSNEIFVFGSNLAGAHAGGAARIANQRFGAQWGVGVGPTGQCYAIPTMHGGIESINPYVQQFLDYVRKTPDKIFLVTQVGCGIAGFHYSDIAMLFRGAVGMPNVALPETFASFLCVPENTWIRKRNGVWVGADK